MKINDLSQFKRIKGEHAMVEMEEDAFKEVWRCYFEILSNEIMYKIL